MFIVSFDLIKKLATQSHFYTYKLRLNYHAKHFLSKMRGRILDVGAGSQPYKILLPKGTEYIAMDIEPSRKPDFVASVLSIPVKRESIDGVICAEVLEHIAEPMRALTEINKILVKDGLLYITVPMTWGHHYEPYDYYRYTKHGLRWLLENSGFRILEIRQIGGVFISMFARMQDIGLSLFYKILYPLKFVIGDKNRIIVASFLAFPLIVILDLFFSFLDQVVPRAKEDALGWVVFAIKSTDKSGPP